MAPLVVKVFHAQIAFARDRNFLRWSGSSTAARRLLDPSAHACGTQPRCRQPPARLIFAHHRQTELRPKHPMPAAVLPSAVPASCLVNATWLPRDSVVGRLASLQVPGTRRSRFGTVPRSHAKHQTTPRTSPPMTATASCLLALLCAALPMARAEHGLTLRVWNNTGRAGEPASTSIVAGPILNLTASGPFSAELEGTIDFNASGVYEFFCNFSLTTTAFVWVDGHMICQDNHA